MRAGIVQAELRRRGLNEPQSLFFRIKEGTTFFHELSFSVKKKTSRSGILNYLGKKENLNVCVWSIGTVL